MICFTRQANSTWQQNIFLILKRLEIKPNKTTKQHKVQKVFKTTKHISKVETLSSSKNTFDHSWKESCDASHSVGRFYNENEATCVHSVGRFHNEN
jgi:hypothetical protein